MARLNEVVIYKYYTKQDIEDLTILMCRDSGHIKLSDGTTVSKLSDGRLEFELIEKDYEYETEP